MFEKFAEDVYRRYIEKMAVLDNPYTQGPVVTPHTQGTAVTPPLRLREVDQLIPSESVEQSASQPVTQSKNNNKPMSVAGKAQQTVGNVHKQMGDYYFNKAQNQENQIREMLKRIENMPYNPEKIEQDEFMKNMNNEMNNFILKQMQQAVYPEI